MELMLNELSIVPLSNDVNAANEKIIKFCETGKRAHAEGFLKIRTDLFAHQIKLSEAYTLQDWLSSTGIPRRYRDFIFSVLIHPFIKEDDETVFNLYDQSKFYFEDTENQIEKIECLGIAAAHLYDTLSISLQSASVWSRTMLSLVIESSEEVSIVKVPNISSETSFNQDEIKEQLENRRALTLVECELRPEEKKIHLSQHHGVAELRPLCNKIKFCPFVMEMRSTDWGGNKFVRSINRDGSVELVLTNEEKRYALWVKTTGRNYKETKAIAEFLEEKYS